MRGATATATARRFRTLPTVDVHGRRVPVASTRLARLLGLALLDEDAAGPGLLFPECRSVHTFGMRFDLDVAFLDAGMAPVRVLRRVSPRRVVSERRASAVLELPAVPGVAS